MREKDNMLNNNVPSDCYLCGGMIVPKSFFNRKNK